LSDLDADIKAAELQAQESAKAVKVRIDRQQADDRSLIARVVVFSFVSLVIIAVVAAIVGAYLFDWNDLVEPGKFVMAILGSIMLPVVTLVIGYYFGTK